MYIIIIISAIVYNNYYLSNLITTAKTEELAMKTQSISVEVKATTIFPFLLINNE